MSGIFDISDAVNSAKITLDPADPMRSARVLLDRLYTREGTRIIHRYRGEFWQWEASHYRPADDEVIRSAIWGFLDQAERLNKDGRAVPFTPNRAVVFNVFEALGAICQLDKSIEPPVWLSETSNLAANEFVAVGNGLLHLPTRELLPPTPTFFGLSASTVLYDPRAPKPEAWLKFLQEVLEDDTAISTAQEWFGYTLSPDTAQEKILLCIGPRRSGKGTMARVQTAMLGKHSVAGPTMGSLSDQFGLEPLIAKPLAIISDARIGQRTDKSVVVERLLSISGEDTLTVARKFKAAWNGRLPTRIEILTNEMPSLADGSGALVGRLIVLLFQHSFYGNEDVGLTTALLKELPGVLNWAIEGYARLQARGHFIQPDSAVETIEAMETLGAPVKAFVRDYCSIGEENEVRIDVLYVAYSNWCASEGMKHPNSKSWFGRNLRMAVPGLKEARPGTDERTRVYRGIALVSSPTPLPF